MKGELWPAIRFLIVFLTTYFGLSIGYGLWIESYNGEADFLTKEVTREVAGIVTILGREEVVTQLSTEAPTVFLKEGQRIILEVYEGCNGVNVMIVFLSFVFAFGGATKARIAGFVAGGLVLIHLANLVRLIMLYEFAFGDMQIFHYYHKYIFTAVLYFLIFAMWWLWITRWSGKRVHTYDNS